MTFLPRVPALAGVLLLASWPASGWSQDLSHYTGEELYQRFCSACHGTGGEGDGTVAAYFKMAPPDLTELTKRNGGSYPAEKLRTIIDGRYAPGPHGSRQMPVWGVAFYYTETKDPDKERAVAQLVDRLVEYLRTIQKE
jgi:mono/diheme cytochrome c family protein